jgi:hypothetical protein
VCVRCEGETDILPSGVSESISKLTLVFHY